MTLSAELFRTIQTSGTVLDWGREVKGLGGEGRGGEGRGGGDVLEAHISYTVYDRQMILSIHVSTPLPTAHKTKYRIMFSLILPHTVYTIIYCQEQAAPSRYRGIYRVTTIII